MAVLQHLLGAPCRKNFGFVSGGPCGSRKAGGLPLSSVFFSRSHRSAETLVCGTECLESISEKSKEPAVGLMSSRKFSRHPWYSDGQVFPADELCLQQAVTGMRDRSVYAMTQG